MEARRGQGWCICFWCSPTGMSLFSRACCFLKQQHMFYLLEWGHVMLHTCWVLWFTSSFSNGSPNCQPFPWPKVVLPTAHGFAALVCGWLHGPVLANYFVHLGAALTSYEFPKGAHYMLTVASMVFLFYPTWPITQQGTWNPNPNSRQRKPDQKRLLV